MTLPRELAHSLVLIALFATTGAAVLAAGLLFGWVLG